MGHNPPDGFPKQWERDVHDTTEDQDMSDGPGKKKVVILGGGIAALSTAYRLTSEADWKERFESITVYQLGWRLGGKGASGRGPCDRIEEHGLHIWIGFYENAFKIMRAAYEELGRKKGEPLATIDDAFKKHSFIVINEQIEGKHVFWPVNCPTNDSEPGVGGEFPTLRDYISMTLQVLRDLLGDGSHSAASPSHASESPFSPSAWGRQLRHRLESGAEALGLTIGSQLLGAIQIAHAQLHSDPAKHSAQDYSRIADLLDPFLDWARGLRARILVHDTETRRAFLLMDLTATCLRGLLRDGVPFHEDGLNALDRYDLREWLEKHGAAPESVWSGPVRFLYDLAFAYEGGDPEKPSFAAGTALRCIGRVFFTYKGAIFWKMQAGMGDTVFTPLYHVLARRGVRFEFFHRVKNLELSGDRRAVARIRIGRQATLKEGECYHPLRRSCDGLECWPSEPLYDQLIEGEMLSATRDSNGLPYNLESFWTPWPDRGEVVLEAGRDFDVVVFGISLGSVPFLCSELVAASERWGNMVRYVQTTRTMGLQLWMKPNLRGLGWTQAPPVMDGYVNPMNTWADMSHLLPQECWPTDDAPGSISYLCGTVTGDIPPQSDHEAPEREFRRAREIARGWLESSAGGLWPSVTSPKGSESLDWRQLVDPQRRDGAERLSAQFWKMNMDPSERYVLSARGSTRYRIKAGESGFDRLYVVGDWIDNGFNAGCIEAAVVSGLQGANALLGLPEDEGIIGCPRKGRGGI